MITYLVGGLIVLIITTVLIEANKNKKPNRFGVYIMLFTFIIYGDYIAHATINANQLTTHEKVLNQGNPILN